MFQKLEAVEKRYEELNKLISDPEVISRQNEWKNLMKEHSDMTDIVEISKKYILVNSINIKSPFIIRAVGDIEKIQNAIEAENSMFAKLKEKGLKYNVEYKKYIKVYKYEVQKEQDKMQIKYMKKI